MAGSPILQEPKKERSEIGPTELSGFFGHLGGISKRSDQPTSTARLSVEGVTTSAWSKIVKHRDFGMGRDSIG